jgi:type III secretion protein C
VRVAGNEEVDLYNISVGVLVKVTPHIIATENGHKIKLSIDVRDGQLSDYSVDGIPVVEESSINTQAVINANESLLIGGTTSENQYKNVRKIPLLGDIPLLGALFRSKKDQKIKRERLFLISPRIIDPDNPTEIPSQRGREIFNNKIRKIPVAAGFNAGESIFFDN